MHRFGRHILRLFSLGLTLCLCAPAIAITAATLSVPPALGTIQTSKNWTYGCDNVLHCDAIALLPPETPDDFLTLRLSRSYDDTELQLQITGLKGKGDRYQIFIDDRLSDTGQIDPNSGAANISNADAMKLARAMTYGKLLTIRDSAQKIIGRVSLLGSMAAFRYLDKTQMRSGTDGALVKRGKHSMRLSPPKAPLITAPRIAAANDIPSASALVALAEGGSCAIKRLGVTQDAVYDLDVSDGMPRALALISCGNGAYNSFSAPYIGTKDAGGAWKFVAARFDYDGSAKNEKGDVALIVNANWDTKSQILSTSNKGRGIGDCGNSADYVWDGTMFRLIRARAMQECRGSLDWISVWRADTKFMN